VPVSRGPVVEDAAVTTALCAGVDADVALRTGQTDRQTHRETERERDAHDRLLLSVERGLHGRRARR